ncbi:MAG TPA: redox-sensing transcriptional repressor Rex [Patescibacteria group bacterium]|nr:redox-sensing transcriptional repressor Rex [Patescibacteria group bacterium]
MNNVQDMKNMIRLKDGVQVTRHTVIRLSLYYRVLEDMDRSDIKVTSSTELGRLCGIGPASIRKDLSYFGEFGKKGVGYSVQKLLWWISEILGYRKCWNTALVGVGVPLMPVNQYFSFMPPGFQLTALFDVDESYQGMTVPESDMEVYSLSMLERVVKAKQISIGLLAVTAEYAQYVANRLIDAGVFAISNFSPVHITTPEYVALVQMNFSDGLSQLSYQLQQNHPVQRLQVGKLQRTLRKTGIL